MFWFLEDAAELETPTETTTQLTQFEKMFDFDFGLNPQLQAFVNKAIEVLAVLIVLIILCKIVDLITKGIKKRMTKKNVEKTVVNVTYYITNKGVKILLLFLAVGCLGIDTTSIVGLFTAAGLGIGLAVQGALSNFAGGILILIIRPFKVDDFIECQGVSGTVEDIHIFYTYLTTPDNKQVMVPNGALVGGNVINYSAKPTRRIDIQFPIDYQENYKVAEQVLLDVANENAYILKDPKATVRISKWGDSSIVLNTRVWVKKEDYWTVYFDLLETSYEALNANNIKIPFNQIEVSYRKATKEMEQEENK